MISLRAGHKIAIGDRGFLVADVWHDASGRPSAFVAELLFALDGECRWHTIDPNQVSFRRITEH